MEVEKFEGNVFGIQDAVDESPANPNLPPTPSLLEKAPVDEVDQARQQIEAYRKGGIKPPLSENSSPSLQAKSFQIKDFEIATKSTLKVIATNTASHPSSAVVDGQLVEEGGVYTSIKSGVASEYKVLEIESERITICCQGKTQILSLGIGLEAFTE